MCKQWKQWVTLFSWAPKSLQMVTIEKKLKTLAPWKESHDHLDSILKHRLLCQQRPSSQSYDFSSGHVWMWELDHKESWAPKNWCFWTVMLEKTLIPWTARRPNQSILKEICPEYSSLEGLIFKLKLQYFSYLMQRTNSFERTVCWERLKVGVNGRDEMIGWHHWLNGHELR